MHLKVCLIVQWRPKTFTDLITDWNYQTTEVVLYNREGRKLLSLLYRIRSMGGWNTEDWMGLCVGVVVMWRSWHIRNPTYVSRMRRGENFDNLLLCQEIDVDTKCHRRVSDNFFFFTFFFRHIQDLKSKFSDKCTGEEG